MFLYLFKYENNSPGEIRGIMRRMIRKSDKSNSWLTAFLSRENRPFPALVVRLSRPALPAPAKLLAPPASNEAVRKSMKGNKRSNTKPELLVRERLRAAGLTGYRLQWKVPGHPDVAWPGKKVALFVNGCFWHRCPHCKPSMPKSNVEYWVVKFERNVERDERSRAALEELGWTGPRDLGMPAQEEDDRRHVRRAAPRSRRGARKRTQGHLARRLAHGGLALERSCSRKQLAGSFGSCGTAPRPPRASLPPPTDGGDRGVPPIVFVAPQRDFGLVS